MTKKLDQVIEILAKTTPDEDSNWAKALKYLEAIAGAVANTIAVGGAPVKPSLRVTLEGIQLPDPNSISLRDSWNKCIPMIYVRSIPRQNQSNSICVVNYPRGEPPQGAGKVLKNLK